MLRIVRSGLLLVAPLALAIGCASPYESTDRIPDSAKNSKAKLEKKSDDMMADADSMAHDAMDTAHDMAQDASSQVPEVSYGGGSSSSSSSSDMSSGGSSSSSSYGGGSSSYGGGGASMSVRQMGDRMVASRAFPTGDVSTSAVMVEKSAPSEVMVGQPYTYEIKVRNLTNHALEQVVVSDVISDTYSLNSANPSPVARDAGLLTWALGDLGPGETRTVEVNGTATSAGSIQYCSEVSYEDRLCLETAVVEPRLRVVKRGPTDVLACDPIAYEIDVTNEGSGTARNVRVTDMLPDGLTSSGSRQVTETIGDLRSGETRTVRVMAQASRTGSFDNSATAEADGGLTSSSNTVTTRVSKPELDITMSCDDRRFGGQNVTYNVAVTNMGDAACDSVVIEATVPAGTTFVSASSGGTGGSKVTWMAGSIGPGETANVEFTVRADTLGPKTSDAKASCVCADPVTTSCTTDVNGIPAVLLEVIDVEDPIPTGGDETYIIRVTNQGTLADTNIVITCDLESEMEYVSNSGATSGSHSAGRVTFAPLPSLAPKDVAEWRLIVRAVSPGDVRFRVTMETDELTRPVEETEATHFYDAN